MQASNFIKAFLFLFLASPITSFGQLTKEIKPLQLDKTTIQNQRIKSVMGMFQVNSAGMEEDGEDYLPRRESYESYERYKGQDFRKFLFYTSLGSFVEYDAAGNITSEINLADKRYTSYTYNDQNKVTSHREIDLNYPTSSDLEMEIEYTYDEKGNIIRYFTGAQEFTFIRNKKGEVTSWKAVEKEYRDPDTEPNPKAGSGDKDISKEFKFDKKGREIRQQSSPDYYTETTYSENPSVTTRSSFEKGAIKQKTIHTLDAKGHLVKAEYYKLKDGKLELFSMRTNSYDDKGNILTQAEINNFTPEKNYELRFVLEYSKTGLPLRRQIFREEDLLGTEIFYYEHF